MMNNDNLNSQEYWDHRFETDWEIMHGREQSRFFARLAFEHLPSWFVTLARTQRFTFCDWGCAQGDGTDVLATYFGRDRVSGVDFSERAVEKARNLYPDITFAVEDWLTENPSKEPYDVVFSSNTLEHFKLPYQVLRRLVERASKCVVLLLPFREFDRHPEHDHTFVAENIPYVPTTDFLLAHAQVIDPKVIVPAYWEGQQILLIYARAAILRETGFTLSEVKLHDEQGMIIEKRLLALANSLEEREKHISYLTESLKDRDRQIGSLDRQIDNLTKELVKYGDLARTGEAEVQRIRESLSWRITAPLRVAKTQVKSKLQLSRKLIDLSRKFWLLSRRKGSGSAVASAHAYLGKLSGNTLFETSGSYDDFDPYSYIETLKPIRTVTIEKNYIRAERSLRFSLIATVLNEEASIRAFLECIAGQSWIPDEIVIVDGGSIDRTTELVESITLKLGLTVKFIKRPGATIAAGRNIAIDYAQNDLVVVCDAGCKLDENLCRNLIGCLTDFPDACLVSGIYSAAQESDAASQFIPQWEINDWGRFLPSSRNLLIRKSLWREAGGYPEYLTKTGEDTLFDINYRRHSRLWVFNKSAVVRWSCPANTEEALRLAWSYGYGDGESAVGDHRFYSVFKRFVRLGEVPSRTDVLSSVARGYLEGRKQRPARELSCRNLKGMVIILSGVPISDSGGGQRGAQLALEFAREGFKVFFVNVYPSFEAPHKIYFDIDLTLVELYQIDAFDIDQVIDSYATLLNKAIMILEFPHPRFLTLIAEARRRKKRPKIIYDYIDNWNSSLGWKWYSEQTEQSIINSADHLVASAKTLQERLVEKSGRSAVFIPNAFNAHLFDPDIRHSRPADLPLGFDRIVLYVGALWGEWFDWDLLNHAVTQMRDSAFVLIGNASDEIKKRANSYATNVFFLGLKPQFVLPSYLAFADVCIIPFKTDHITKYVNPLKLYEYLAMKKPIVTTAIEELDKIPGVRVSHSANDFINNINLPPRDGEIIDRSELVATHSWKIRIAEFLGFLRSDEEVGY